MKNVIVLFVVMFASISYSQVGSLDSIQTSTTPRAGMDIINANDKILRDSLNVALSRIVSVNTTLNIQTLLNSYISTRILIITDSLQRVADSLSALKLSIGTIYLTGAGIPSNSIGINGNLYWDSVGLMSYYKSNNVWKQSQ